MLERHQKNIVIAIFVDTENVTTRGFRCFVQSLKLMGDVDLNVCMHSERLAKGKWFGMTKELDGRVLHTKRLRKGKSCMDVFMATHVCARIVREKPEILILCSGDSDFAELVRYAKSNDVHVIGYANQIGCANYEALFDQFVTAGLFRGAINHARGQSVKTRRPFVVRDATVIHSGVT
ncbi:hypothetical protein ST37_05965 [Vibrio sp. qd031]|uniref:NYN domain-containing protein n=1 Tax=Vibrio sp. qd031 TaxID=1603038 RepID=UPI000A0F90D4|nr:NYN domain-containing protein [Vibrio sp. qd031]ORT50942.1 hypothetical protein ST37_05965 [Vibrio sp. qd031]